MGTRQVFSYLTCLLGLVSFACGGNIGAPSGGDINAALDSLEFKLNWLDYRIAGERWDRESGGEADSLEFFDNLRQAVTGSEATFNTFRGSRGRLDEETDRRRYDLVYPEVLHSYVNHNRNIRSIFDSLTDYHQHRQYEFGGDLRTPEYLCNQVDRSTSRTDREMAYRALNAPGEAVQSLMGRLFRLRNQTAKRFGYNNYFAFTESARQNEPSGYLQLISRVDSVSRQQYQEILAGLRDDFREGVLEIWDWEYSSADVWRELDRYLAADSQMDFLKLSLADLGFDLDNSPIYFHEIYDSASPAFARTIVVSLPHDIRVVCHLSDGLRSLRNLFRATGQAIRAAETSQGSDLLGRTVDPAWAMGVGRFFEDLCLQPEWLRTYAQVPENLIGRVTRARQAHDLLNLRLLLTNAMFEYEAYRNPNSDLNTLWWELFETYTMLPRNEDLQPWAVSESFVFQPLGYHDQLQAEMIAAQTRAYLTEHYNTVVGNPEVRSFLEHNYFRFGGRYPWRELVERGTGEAPSPAYLAVE